MRVLVASAELAPFVKVGGLGDSVAGLAKELSRRGVDVEIALPDYGGLPFNPVVEWKLAVPDWAGPAIARRGRLAGFDQVTLIRTPHTARSHPYTGPDGSPWPDLDRLFLSFSAGLGRLASSGDYHIVHLNDWHTAGALAFMEPEVSTVFTIHNLAYQGASTADWLDVLERDGEAFTVDGRFNAMAGAIELADQVVTVSPGFASEAITAGGGFGLGPSLARRGDAFGGIINGIDTEIWDPAGDPVIRSRYEFATVERRDVNRAVLLERAGWPDDGGPLVGMVTRMTEQKGVDLALALLPVMGELGGRMILLGSGDPALVAAAVSAATEAPDHLFFTNGHDEAMSHRIFAGSDLFLMPSRFEPCGLSQMQAMRYGCIPIVTAVGGLRDTVIDADADPERGTGFLSPTPAVEPLADALRRAVEAWNRPERRRAIQERGMTTDWSWAVPARRYEDLYEHVTRAG